jgi:hypothetical protein
LEHYPVGYGGLSENIGGNDMSKVILEIGQVAPRIALDSNCVSYLIDACNGQINKEFKHAVEGEALVRIWYYLAQRYYISERVLLECGRIRDEPRREIHKAFSLPTYFGSAMKDLAAVQKRADDLLLYHPKDGDCLVLAEAEDMEADTLLCCDNDFIKKLSPVSEMVRIMRPTEYWQEASVPKGAIPKIVPEASNPLHSNTFWRW